MGFTPSPDFGGIKTGIFHGRVLADSGTILPNVAPPTIDALQKIGIYPPVLLYSPGTFKEGVVYSQFPVDGSGDFVVSRSTTTAGETGFSTTLNYKGYYQNMLPDYPTIDYSTIGVPALKTQPEREQLVTRPLSFGHSDWTKSGATIEGDPSTAGSELVTNGDMEAGLATVNGVSFTGYHSTQTQSSAQKHAGSNSLLVTATADAFNGYVMPNDVSMTSNMYLMDFWVYKPAALTGDISIMILSGGVEQITNTLTTNDTWTNFQIYIEAQIPSTDRYIMVQAVDGLNTEFFYIDDVSIKQVTGYPSPMLAPDLGSEIVPSGIDRTWGTDVANSAEFNTDYKLVITRDGAVVKIYLDGVDITSVSGTHANPATAVADNLYQGSFVDGSGRVYGTISEYVIYTKELTPTEVLGIQ